MRPLFLFWGGGEGGDASVAIDLAAAFKERGIRAPLAAYAYAKPDTFRAKSVAAGLEADHDFFLISEPGRVWEEAGLSRSDFDLIHVHHGRTVPKRTDIVPLKHAAGRLPLVITAHGPLPLSSIQYGGLKSKVSRMLSPLWFDAVVVPSEAKAREWRRMTLLGKKVTVIPNIVRFFPRVGRCDARRQFGIEPRTEAVLYCSRLDPDKDPLLFIRAVAESAKKRPNLKGYMAGNGELSSQCDSLIKDLEAPVYRLGYIQNPAHFYNAGDVFVQPSLYESFGLTVLHAVELGLPCVATNIEVFQDLYAGEFNIEWFKPGDIAGCARGILSHLESPNQELPTMHLRERFSADAAVEAHLKLWETVLEKKWASTRR